MAKREYFGKKKLDGRKRYENYSPTALAEYVRQMNIRRFLHGIGHVVGTKGDVLSLEDLQAIQGEDHWIWTGVSHIHKLRGSPSKPYPRFRERLVNGQDVQWYTNQYAFYLIHGRRPIKGVDRVLNVCGEDKCICPYEPHNIIVQKGLSKSEKEELQVRYGQAGRRRIITNHPDPVGLLDDEKRTSIPSFEEFMSGSKKPH